MSGEAAAFGIGLLLAGAGAAWTSPSVGACGVRFFRLGLVSLGGGSEGAVVSEMLSYAHDTAHEKTVRDAAACVCAQMATAYLAPQVRGIAVALAFVCYEQEERADALIEQMTSDKVYEAPACVACLVRRLCGARAQDPILRAGAMQVCTA